MSQRELKVKVSADIDNKLEKLLSLLKTNSSKTLKVKVFVDDKSFTKLQAKIKQTDNKKLTINTNSKGVSLLQTTLGKIRSGIDKVNGMTVKPSVDTSGLTNMANTLDNLSKGVLSFAGRVTSRLGKGLAEESGDLFDAQKAFITQMNNLEKPKSQEWIKESMADMQKYGAQTKFSVGELINLMGNLEGAGVDASREITTGIAGISSMSKNPSNALNRVSTQVKQMSKDGKVYTRDWNAIRDAIGGAGAEALKTYFKNEKGIDDLTEAMSRGEVVGKDFFDAIQAVGNGNQFQKMAKQSDTLSSSLANMQETLITTLLGTPYDQGPLYSVYEDIVGLVNDITDSAPQIASIAEDLVNQLKGLGKDLFGDFDFGENINGLVTGLKPLMTIVGVLGKGLGKLNNHGKNTGLIIGAIISASAGWLVLRKVSSGIMGITKAMQALNGISGKGLGRSGSKGSVSGSDFMQGQLGGVLGMVKNVGYIVGIAGSVKLLASAYKDIASVNVSWQKAMNNLAQMGVVTGATATALGVIGVALNRIPKAKQSIATGALAMSGVALSLVVMSKALEVVGKAKIDKNLGRNVMNMAKVLGAVTVGLTAIGGLFVGFPVLLASLTVGAGVLLSVSGVMVITTGALVVVAKETKALVKEVKALNKMDIPDLTEFASKLGKLLALQALFTGYSVASGTLGIVDLITGFMNSLGAFGRKMTFTSLESFVNNIKSFMTASKGIPPIKGFKNSLQRVIGLQEEFSTLTGLGEGKGFQDIFNQIDQFFLDLDTGLSKIANTFATNTIIDSLTNVSTFANQLTGMQVPTWEGIKDKVSSLTQLQEALSGTVKLTNEDYYVGWEMWAKSLKSLADKITTGNVIESMQKVINFANSLKRINVPKPDSLSDKFESIKGLTKEIQKFGGEGGFVQSLINTAKSIAKNLEDGSNSKNLDILINTLTKVIDFSNKLNGLKVPKGDSVSTKLESLKTTIKKIEKFDLGSIEAPPKEIGTTLKAYTTVVNQLKKFVEIVNGFPEVDITGRLNTIQTALEKIKTLAGSDLFKEGLEKGVQGKINKLKTFITDLSSIATSLQTIMSVGDLSGVPNQVEMIKKALQKITEEGGLTSSMTKFPKDLQSKHIAGVINNISKIGTALATIQALALDDSVNTKISTIKKALMAIATEPPTLQGVSSFFEGVNLEGIPTTIKKLVTIAQHLVTLGTIEVPEDINARVLKIKLALMAIATDTISLQGLVSLFSDVDLSSVSTAIDKFVSIGNKLNNIPAINEEDIKNRVRIIKNVIKDISGIGTDESTGSLSTVMATLVTIIFQLNLFATTVQSLGNRAGTNFSNGWKTGVGDKLFNKVKEQKDKISNIDFSSAGSRLADSLVRGFDVSKMLNKIRSIQNAIDNLHGKTIDITINETTVSRKVKRQHGGIIPEYHSTGGAVGQRGFKQSGTDTVPAMLTAGEFVIKRSVVSALGRSFFDNINRMNIQSAYATMAGKLKSTVVNNNTTNNISQKVDNMASYNNGLTKLGRVVRP